MRKIGMAQAPYKCIQRRSDKGGKILESTIEKIRGLTWLSCKELFVVDHKTIERDGYNAMVLGFGSKKLSKIHRPQRYLRRGYEEGFGPEKVYEHKTDDLLPIGTAIEVEKFLPVGSFVDVEGYTKGRGFTGVMKAWNFSGTRASHGVTKTHRCPGSSGGKRAEGRVMPGKKMPKNYGNEKVTMQNIRVAFSEKVQIEGKEAVFLVGLDGGVPGSSSSLCLVSRAVKKGEAK